MISMKKLHVYKGHAKKIRTALQKKLRGFTLIELLTSMGIIAALASIVISAINPIAALCESNNTRRIGAANSLTKAWQQFGIENPMPNTIPTGYGNRLPMCKAGVTDPTCIDASSSLVTTYISAIPVDSDEKNTNYSGYDAYIDSNNRISVVAQNMAVDCRARCILNDTSLIGYWRFDENLEGAASDSTVNRRHGDYVNRPLPNTADVAPLRFNNPASIQFTKGMSDPNKDHISLSTAESAAFEFPLNSSFTVSLWMKTGTGTYWHDLVTNESHLNRTGFGIGMGGTAAGIYDGRLYFRNRNTCCPAAFGTTNVKNNQWHHVVGVKQGDTVQLYVDGVLEGTTTGANVDISAAYDVRFGMDFNNAFPYTGQLDDLRIYNRALTTTEITRLAQGYCT